MSKDKVKSSKVTKVKMSRSIVKDQGQKVTKVKVKCQGHMSKVNVKSSKVTKVKFKCQKSRSKDCIGQSQMTKGQRSQRSKVKM